jgi:hypothetical protein
MGVLMKAVRMNNMIKIFIFIIISSVMVVMTTNVHVVVAATVVFGVAKTVVVVGIITRPLIIISLFLLLVQGILMLPLFMDHFLHLVEG